MLDKTFSKPGEDKP